MSSKTYSGGIQDTKKRPKVVTAHENVSQPQRCVVRLYEKYLSLRPPNIKRFYLRPLAHKMNSAIWYSSQPKGVNKIKKVVTNIMEKANITGKFTNHSLRASAATRLFRNGVEEQLVAYVTGHRSNAIQNYKRISNEQTSSISSIIQCNSTTSAGIIVQEPCCSSEPKAPKLSNAAELFGSGNTINIGTINIYKK